MATRQQAVAWATGGWRQSPYLTTIPGIGTGIDVDKAYGLQCMDFPNGYSLNFGWGRFTNFYAYQMWANHPAGYAQVQDPQPGDVFVLNQTGSNIAGHTGIVVSARSRNDWTSTDQNWFNSSNTQGSPPAVVNHNASNLLGFLRPPLTEVTPVAKATKEDIESMFRRYLGYSAGENNPWVGQDYEVADSGIRLSPEGIAYRTGVLLVYTPAEYEDIIARLKAEGGTGDSAEYVKVSDIYIKKGSV